MNKQKKKPSTQLGALGYITIRTCFMYLFFAESLVIWAGMEILFGKQVAVILWIVVLGLVVAITMTDIVSNGWFFDEHGSEEQSEL